MWRPDTAGATLSGSTRTLEAPQLLTRAGLQSGPEVLAAPPGLSVTSNLPHPAPDFTASSGEIRGSGQKVSAGFGAFYRPQPQGRTRGTCGFRARATDTALRIRTTRIAPSALQGDGLYGCGHGGGPSGEGGSGGDPNSARHQSAPEVCVVHTSAGIGGVRAVSSSVLGRRGGMARPSRFSLWHDPLRASSEYSTSNLLYFVAQK